MMDEGCLLSAFSLRSNTILTRMSIVLHGHLFGSHIHLADAKRTGARPILTRGQHNVNRGLPAAAALRIEVAPGARSVLVLGVVREGRIVVVVGQPHVLLVVGEGLEFHLLEVGIGKVKVVRNLVVVQVRVNYVDITPSRLRVSCKDIHYYCRVTTLRKREKAFAYLGLVERIG